MKTQASYCGLPVEVLVQFPLVSLIRFNQREQIVETTDLRFPRSLPNSINLTSHARVSDSDQIRCSRAFEEPVHSKTY
jgi:hypothetical protein